MSKKVKVEVLPPGICIGAIDSEVERLASGFYRTYGAVGVGSQMKEAKRKKGRLFLHFKKRGG